MNIKGEHEDLIYKNREFIMELGKVQELYFENLCTKLGGEFAKDGELKDILFDYVYNCNEEEMKLSFEEYLNKLGT